MKNVIQGMFGGLLVVLLCAFTNQNWPARHFTPLSPLSRYVTTVVGDSNNTGVAIPTPVTLYTNGTIATLTANDGGIEVTPHIEYGLTTLSAGTKTITFSNAFGVAPICVCSDNTAIAACDVTGTTTTQMTLGGTTTDRVYFICIGG